MVQTRACYLCGQSFGLSSYPFHIKTCKELYIKKEKNKPLPLDPNPEDAMTSMTLEEINKVALNVYKEAVCYKCEHCSRSFFKEQLLKHNRSCTAEKPMFVKRSSSVEAAE